MAQVYALHPQHRVPPESSRGHRRSNPCSPTSRASSAARRCRSARFTRRSANGSAMFRSIVYHGNKFLGGNSGLGYLLVAKMNAYETDSLFAVIALLTLVGFVFYAAVGAARRLLIPWHDSAS